MQSLQRATNRMSAAHIAQLYGLDVSSHLHLKTTKKNILQALKREGEIGIQ